MADVKGPLVSTNWLARELDRDNLAVLDATWFVPGDARDAKSEFAERHVPGAVFFDIDAISDRANPLPARTPLAARFRHRRPATGREFRLQPPWVYDLSRGVPRQPRSLVDLPGRRDPRPDLRARRRPAQMARRRTVFPHRVRAWPAAAHGDFKARFRPELVRNVAEVTAALASGAEQLADARPAARFRGEAPEPRAGLRDGHMPGARNLPYSALLNDNGEMKPPAALIAAFEAAGIDLEQPVVGSCGSRISAAVVALALARLGRPDAAVYDGSWAEWGGRDDTVVVAAPED